MKKAVVFSAMTILLSAFSMSGAKLPGPKEGYSKPFPGKIQLASGKYVRDVKQQCVENQYSLLGNAWLVDLSVGGVTADVGQYPAIQPNVDDLYGLSYQKFTAPAGQVNLIIVDDFKNTRDIQILDGSKRRVEGKTVPESFTLSHGYMVMAHARMILESARFTTTNGRVFKKGARQINVVPVDYGVLRDPGTAVVRTQRLAQLLSQAVNPQNFNVINMSFSIIPCELAADYHWYRLNEEKKSGGRIRPNIDAYIQHLKDINGDLIDAPAFKEAMLRADPNDPLVETLGKYRRTPTNALVASSGNYGLPFSTLPASLPGVVGVGGMTLGDFRQNVPKLAAWSDAGDTYSVGQWFRFSSPLSGLNRVALYCAQGFCVSPALKRNTNGSLGPNAAKYVNFGYLGTSFSSPTVAAYLAMTMTPTTRAAACESLPTRMFKGTTLKAPCP